MTLISTAEAPKRAARLGPDDWIAGALDLLVAGGIDAVQITVLAKRLDVTRGSFYWHFTGREDLLDALLAEWRARNRGVLEETLAGAADVERGVLDLFSVWVGHTRFDATLDRAVRDWGRHEAAVSREMGEEDDARVAAIAAFYERCGYAPTEAFVRARVIYFTQLSYYALGVEEPMERRVAYLDAYFLCFTGREIDPSVAEDYRAMLVAGAEA